MIWCNRCEVQEKRVLVEKGVRIFEQTEVKSFRTEKDEVISVVTNQGDFEVNEFVASVGAWTPYLQALWGAIFPYSPARDIPLP